MSRKIAAEVDELIESQEPPADKLEVLRATARRLRDIDLEVKNLSERIEVLGSERGQLLQTKLPELLGDAGIPRIDLEADGNLPAIRVEMRPFYSANIAAGWAEEKRQLAFKYLAEVGAEDLIKTTLTIKFSREDRRRAVLLFESLQGQKLAVEIKEAVSNQTLTSWLRERSEKNEPTKLDLIGGFVGRIATVREV